MDCCVAMELFLVFGLHTELVSSRVGASVISLEHEMREKWSNFSLEKLFEGKIASQISVTLLSRKQSLDIVAYCSTEGLERLVEAISITWKRQCQRVVLAGYAGWPGWNAISRRSLVNLDVDIPIS